MRIHRITTITSMLGLALVLAAGVCVVADVPSASVRTGNELQKRASWAPLTADQVGEQLTQWLNTSQADEALRKRVTAVWNGPANPSGDAAMLDRVTASIAAADPRMAEIATMLTSDGQVDPARFPFLFDEQTPPFVRYNVRLAYGRWLSQQGQFDESLEQLGGLTPQQVVDPAALLFYQAVAYHRLLKKEECLAALDKLLENEAHLPRRYTTVAKLMDADIRPLEADSLDEVARLMSDVRRRLGFGHAGKRVRQEEDDVIAKLDKKIKDIEEQMKKMPAAGKGAGNAQPSNPAQDSGNFGGKGAGDVDQKKIGSKSGWGNLPPKEREQALQQISKDLPAHYREAIEEYFRKLSREGGK